ncbi:MAG: hypothetical protein HY898_32800 [Deltaproteobacteria bacterium]|nr:hypothetical protein [Deltaproteobacteria bacterium]
MKKFVLVALALSALAYACGGAPAVPTTPDAPKADVPAAPSGEVPAAPSAEPPKAP